MNTIQKTTLTFGVRHNLKITVITSCLYEWQPVITYSDSKLRHFITSTIYNFNFICSLPVQKSSQHFTHHTSQHLISQRMKRLPWADVIPLDGISSARLISHRDLRCHWSTHLIVIVRM